MITLIGLGQKRAKVILKKKKIKHYLTIPIKLRTKRAVHKYYTPHCKCVFHKVMSSQM